MRTSDDPRLPIDFDLLPEPAIKHLSRGSDEGWSGIIDDDGNWLGKLWFAEIDGRFECVGVAVLARRDQPVTGEVVRQFSVSKTTREWREIRGRSIKSRLRFHSDPELKAKIPPELHLTDEQVAKAQQKLSSVRRRKSRYGIDHWREVAEVWLTARRDGSLGPTADVAAHFTARWKREVKRSTASRWVMTCRELDLIPPVPARGNGR